MVHELRKVGTSPAAWITGPVVMGFALDIRFVIAGTLGRI